MARCCIAGLLVAVLLAPGLAADPVRVGSGRVSGVASGDVRVYKGIPFAAAPVGKLRWRPPQPVVTWEGIRRCTAFAPSCPQPRQIVGRDVGERSEDCLYLNVWTPAEAADGRLPVMVWIHGGGHTTGSGSLSYYDGESLARQGVVVVTINYRLGPLGYLAHPLLSKESGRGVSGNYGMLDQIAALRWVQRNIAAFGGDPGRVTIFGESAGAVSVCRLMISPLAKGLFHRAIAQSGGAHGRNRHLRQTWYGMEPMEKVGERLATALGCDQADDPLAALRAASAEQLLEASRPSQGLFGKGIKFGPVIDGWAIPDDPTDLWAAGKQHSVPFMAGSNADEGSVFLKQLPIRHILGYKLTVRMMFREHADRVLALFPAQTDQDVRPAMNRMVTMSAFAAPMRSLARSMAKVDAPGYLYHFTRVAPGTAVKPYGAFHGLEIGYVFGTLKPALGPTPRDWELSKAMSACWARFAKTGDPNGEGIPAWPVYQAATDQHLEFGDAVEVKAGLHKSACDLFDELAAARRATRDTTPVRRARPRRTTPATR